MLTSLCLQVQDCKSLKQPAGHHQASALPALRLALEAASALLRQLSQLSKVKGVLSGVLLVVSFECARLLNATNI